MLGLAFAAGMICISGLAKRHWKIGDQGRAGRGIKSLTRCRHRYSIWRWNTAMVGRRPAALTSHRHQKRLKECPLGILHQQTRQDKLRKSYLEAHHTALVNPVCQQGLGIKQYKSLPKPSSAAFACRENSSADTRLRPCLRWYGQERLPQLHQDSLSSLRSNHETMNEIHAR